MLADCFAQLDSFRTCAVSLRARLRSGGKEHSAAAIRESLAAIESEHE